MESLNSKKDLWTRPLVQDKDLATDSEGPTSYESKVELEHPAQPACCWNACFPVTMPKVPRPAVNKMSKEKEL